MTRKLLLFCVDQDRLREIRRLAQRMDIEVVRIERPSYWQKLGYLAKMTGFTEEARVYMGAEFPEEIRESGSGLVSCRLEGNWTLSGKAQSRGDADQPSMVASRLVSRAF